MDFTKCVQPPLLPNTNNILHTNMSLSIHSYINPRMSVIFGLRLFYTADVTLYAIRHNASPPLVFLFLFRSTQ